MGLKYQAVRGTHDILPGETEAFQHLEAESRQLFKQFGFHEIRTPTFESLDLFRRSLGETTDVVEKEMYAFEDRGGRKLALRPEGTAGVVRAFVEHHIDQTQPFCKLFYMGPMFRAERPQAGRYREFWQIGAEYFGNASPAADAEVLWLLESLFNRLGVHDFQLKLNSLGCDDCRPRYRQALVDFLKKVKSSLCEDCQRRIDKNPLRVLDCKQDGSRLTTLPTVDAFWCDACRSHFGLVRLLFEKAGGHYVFTPRLVRGLDYYSRTVFEVTTSVLGAQDALAAGGRYDRLVKDLGGGPVPALGFALGSERTLQVLQAGPDKKPKSAQAPGVRLFVAALGEMVLPEAFQLLQSLRLDPALASQGLWVEGGFFEKKIGAQLTIADRVGSTHCLILGTEEIQGHSVTLRDLKKGTQERISRSDLIPQLLKRHAQNPLD